MINAQEARAMALSNEDKIAQVLEDIDSRIKKFAPKGVSIDWYNQYVDTIVTDAVRDAVIAELRNQGFSVTSGTGSKLKISWGKDEKD